VRLCALEQTQDVDLEALHRIYVRSAGGRCPRFDVSRLAELDILSGTNLVRTGKNHCSRTLSWINFTLLYFVLISHVDGWMGG
jgi:hypothetical protein